MLEAHSQRKLYDTGAAIPGGRSEQRIGLLARGQVKPCRGVQPRPLRVVESVVELTTNLKLHAFAGKTEVLECGQVELILSGSPDHLPRGTSNVAQARRGKHCGIEEPAAVSRSVPEVRVAGHIDSLAVSTADQIGPLYGIEPDARGRAAGKRDC